MRLENTQPKSTENLSEFPRQPLLNRFSLIILSRATKNAIEDIRTQIQTINESLLTIQTMIVSLTATKPDEIQLALDYINQRSQIRQMLVAELTELDTPRLSDLQERLRHLQQKEMAEPLLEKSKRNRNMSDNCWPILGHDAEFPGPFWATPQKPLAHIGPAHSNSLKNNGNSSGPPKSTSPTHNTLKVQRFSRWHEGA